LAEVKWRGASVVTDSSGNKVGEMRFMPWGETRHEGSNIPTSHKYTGPSSRNRCIG
jgi:hypothetical protein